MPAYEICYLDRDGILTYKFAATCDDDNRAKVLAHAMKLPSVKRLEVWNGEALISTSTSEPSSRMILSSLSGTGFPDSSMRMRSLTSAW